MQPDCSQAGTLAAPTGRAGLQRDTPPVGVGDAELKLRVAAIDDRDPSDVSKIARCEWILRGRVLCEWIIPDVEDPSQCGPRTVVSGAGDECPVDSDTPRVAA